MHGQVLSVDEARSAVCAAIRLQAGRFESTPVHLPPSVTIQFPSTPSSSSSSPPSSSSSTSYLLVSTTPSSSSSGIRTGTVEDVTAEIRAETRSTAATAKGAVAVTGIVKETTKNGTGRLRLTYWALDTALSAVFKGPNPRLGRPSARTKVTVILILTNKLR